MSLHLPPEDLTTINHILENAAQNQGGMPQLLSMPLRLKEVDGRIQFVYPPWMTEIRHYLGEKYGESESTSLMQDILFELTAHPDSAHL